MPWEPEPDDEGAVREVCSDPPGRLPVEFKPVGTVELRVPVDTEPDVNDGEDPVVLPSVAVLLLEIVDPLCSMVRKRFRGQS